MEQRINHQHVEALGNANRNAGPEAQMVLINEGAGIRILAEILERCLNAIMYTVKGHRGCRRTDIAEKVNNKLTDFQVCQL